MFKVILYAGATLAAAITNKHVADFRGFGTVGCEKENLGVWTVIDDDVVERPCTVFGDKVLSVKMVDIVGYCSMYLYEDPECKTEARELTQYCLPALGGWKAWKMVCESE